MASIQINRASGNRAKNQTRQSPKTATHAQKRNNRVREAESGCHTSSDRGGHIPRGSNDLPDIDIGERRRSAHSRSNHRLAH